MKQTAVLWLQQTMTTHLTDAQVMSFEGLFQQALEMEREQIIQAWHDADNDYIYSSEVKYHPNGEEYYYDHFVEGNKKVYKPDNES